MVSQVSNPETVLTFHVQSLRTLQLQALDKSSSFVHLSPVLYELSVFSPPRPDPSLIVRRQTIAIMFWLASMRDRFSFFSGHSPSACDLARHPSPFNVLFGLQCNSPVAFGALVLNRQLLHIAPLARPCLFRFTMRATSNPDRVTSEQLRPPNSGPVVMVKFQHSCRLTLSLMHLEYGVGRSERHAECRLKRTAYAATLSTLRQASKQARAQHGRRMTFHTRAAALEVAR